MSSLPNIPHDESLVISSEGLNKILAEYDSNKPDKNFLWCNDYRVELPVRVKKTGPGS